MINILVPVNFTDYSLNALLYAVQLTEKFKAGITILHCFSDYLSKNRGEIDEEVNSSEIELQEQEYRERLRLLTAQMVDKAALLHDNLQVQYRFELGYPEDVIPQVSLSMKSDIIIMGTSSKDDELKQVMGSVTGDVVKKATAPVLAVPARSKVNHRKLGKILFLMELDERDFFSLHRLMRIITPFNTQVIAVHYHSGKKLTTAEEEKMAELKSCCTAIYKSGNIDFTSITGSNFGQSIEDFVKGNHIDLIAMTRKRRTILRKLFDPSATKKMLYETDTPLLIFHS